MPNYFIHLDNNDFDKINVIVMTLGQIFIRNRGEISNDDLIKFNSLVSYILQLNHTFNSRMLLKIKSEKKIYG